MRWIIVTLVVALQAASCGQKGPLELPRDATHGPRLEAHGFPGA